MSSEIDAEWVRMKRAIHLANTVSSTDEQAGAFKAMLTRSADRTVNRCRIERKRIRDAETPRDTSNEAIRRAARFTDGLPLDNYNGILHLVPRLVNVVTLAEAIPIPGSGLKLPLNLHTIGSRCSNSYYAPRRFAAVQLAFDAPRCRVLVFHTGRLVGTGCSGPMAARLSIMRAARQLAVEANVHIHVRNFQVINQVGAVSIDARLDCDAMAETHSATAHYDRQSFVGLAWRPQGESICCEIYSTGRANLPGSTRERSMLHSFSRMLPELLRHSDRKDVLDLIKDELKEAHRPRVVQRDDATAQEDACLAAVAAHQQAAAVQQAPRRSSGLWEATELCNLDGLGSLGRAMETDSEYGLLCGGTGDEDADEALLDEAGF